MADVEDSVESRWMALTQTVPPELALKWWQVIQDQYSMPHRKYHNLTHLQRMFEHVEVQKAHLSSPDVMYYALVFQYLEYDPQSADNEEAAIQRFKEFVKESGTLNDSTLSEQVEELMGSIRTHCTEEHKTEGSYGQEDKHFFLDFDMSYLGSTPAEYAEFIKLIRDEYEFLPDKTYKMLRSKILKSFLQIPNIFATKQFRESYEKQARINIEQEIAELGL